MKHPHIYWVMLSSCFWKLMSSKFWCSIPQEWLCCYNFSFIFTELDVWQKGVLPEVGVFLSICAWALLVSPFSCCAMICRTRGICDLLSSRIYWHPIYSLCFFLFYNFHKINRTSKLSWLEELNNYHPSVNVRTTEVAIFLMADYLLMILLKIGFLIVGTFHVWVFYPYIIYSSNETRFSNVRLGWFLF